MTMMRKSATALTVAAAVALAGCDTGVLEVDDGAFDDAPALSNEMASTVVCQVIDFEQFTENGALVESVPSGFGFDLAVSVVLSPEQAEQSLEEARIFDVNAMTVTNDVDLRDDAVGGDCPDCGPQGNVLIIQQKPGFPTNNGDLIPDDSRTGGRIVFSGFAGQGTFYLDSFVAVDDDAGEPAFAASVDGVELAPTSSALGNGTVELVAIGTAHTIASQMSFEYRASGAIDDLRVCKVEEEERGEEGCTPGYWKQEQHFDSYPMGYTPETLMGDIFDACDMYSFDAQKPASGDICELSLLEALSLGGGGANALARHAAAAYLNAASDMVAYYYTTGEIVDMVNAAIESGEYSGAKDTLEEWNEDTPCPLN